MGDIRSRGDHPDIYADGFQISASQRGVTLTLLRSEPTGELGPHEEPTVIVGRVRIPVAMVEALADELDYAAAQLTGQVTITSQVPQGGTH